jgi:predicted TIM-barrel fold metal-dependent hydrolase
MSEVEGMRTIAIEEHFRSEAARKALASGQLSDADYPMLAPALADLDDVGGGRLAGLDGAGIDVQVLSHTPPGPEAAGPGAAVVLAQAMNDELAAIIREHPARYAGFAMLPTAQPVPAADELCRAVTQLGLRGAMVHGTTAGRFLDHPDFAPILEKAAQLGVPIYLHPAVPSPTIRSAYYSGFAPEVSAYLATSAWGWHIETGLQALRLVLAGTFDRHPGLQVIIGHMGEALPFMLARTDSVLNRHTKLERPLLDYFTQNLHYTTSGFFTHAPLGALVEVVGTGRVIFAVDYPYSSNTQARAFLDAMPVSASVREQIAHGNAEALLKL